MVNITLDNVSFHLKELHNFDFLKKYGEVFCVFDEQDSDNICFGIKHGEKKIFIKYVGAKTIKYTGEPNDAVNSLAKAMLVYQELAHASLINLIEYYSIEYGYVAVFKWTDGDCMGKQYASSQKFKKLSVQRKIEILDTVFNFHKHVMEQGYVAVDFYDGSILYNFETCKTTICDIDFYQKQPFQNNMGRMWGSSRFMSPEEYILGANIDEITNIYTMGATAFVLLGGEQDHSFEKWSTSKALYDVALKAVNKDRNERYQSIGELIKTWNNAKSEA